MFTTLPGQEKLSSPKFIADDLGPCVLPSIQTNDPEFGQIDRSPPLSERTWRIVNTYNTTTENQANILLLIYSE